MGKEIGIGMGGIIEEEDRDEWARGHSKRRERGTDGPGKAEGSRASLWVSVWGKKQRAEKLGCFIYFIF